MNDDMPEETAKATKPRDILRRLVTLGAAVSLPLLLLGLLPFESLATDLPSHFMMQYAMGSGVLLVLAAWCRPRKAVFAALGAVFILSLWQVAPFLLPEKAQAPQATGQPLRILAANVLFINRDAARFKKLIKSEKPDVIVASEVNSVFGVLFKGLKKDYPYQKILPEDDNPRGLAVASGLPLENVEKTFFDNEHVPSLRFTLKYGGKTFSFLSIHPFTPVVSLARRDNEFRLIAEKLGREDTGNLVILGDFNATPWCNGYKSLANPLKLKNARAGRGIFPSWPAFYPLPFLRIPIDHVLLGGNIAARGFRLGPDIGSDHLPVIVDID